MQCRSRELGLISTRDLSLSIDDRRVPVSGITPSICRGRVCMQAALHSRRNCVEIEARAVFTCRRCGNASVT
jgi:hypothetical protein